MVCEATADTERARRGRVGRSAGGLIRDDGSVLAMHQHWKHMLLRVMYEWRTHGADAFHAHADCFHRSTGLQAIHRRQAPFGDGAVARAMVQRCRQELQPCSWKE